MKKLITLLSAAAIGTAALSAGPAVFAADTNTIWDYAFEGSDVGGNWSGYSDSLVTEDPSDESNHVYKLGANQITKTPADGTFAGVNVFSFDFEYVEYYNSVSSGAGDCTFSALLYRNGGDWHAADTLSTLKNGELRFNGITVLQDDQTHTYYLKDGRYHVEWTVDTEKKHQTVTLTGKINSSNRTITVFDGAIPELNNTPYEFTKGMQLKGNTIGVYIDNIKVVKETESEQEEPTITFAPATLSGTFDGSEISDDKITVNGKDIKVYTATVTAPENKPINGGTITATVNGEKKENTFNTTMAEGSTACIYCIVAFNGSASEVEWSYTID